MGGGGGGGGVLQNVHVRIRGWGGSFFLQKIAYVRDGWPHEQLNNVLKTSREKLLKVLRKNKIFTKQVLFENFKIELCLNKEPIGWKLGILTDFL